MLKGKRIVLTGCTGQVGGAFADQLAPHNTIWGLARFTAPGSRERLDNAGVHTVKGDFTKQDFGDIPDDIDYVVHLAANTKPGVAEVGMTQNAEGVGWMMHRFRNAKAFFMASNNTLYLDNPDPLHKFVETDHVGGSSPHSPNYGPTKLAGEGVARFLSQLYGLPTIIARLNVSYGGPYDDGGYPGHLLDWVLEGRPIRMPKSRTLTMSPIHEDDMVRQLEPMLAAASVPATIVNWGGAEPVEMEEMARYIGALVGKEPVFEYDDAGIFPNRITDTTRGRSIGMEWRVPWKEGIRRMIAARRPDISIRSVVDN